MFSYFSLNPGRFFYNECFLLLYKLPLFAQRGASHAWVEGDQGDPTVAL